jgi:hypothetical protein
MEHVGMWLRSVKDYYEMPDLWAELRGGGSGLVGAALEGTHENTPFTKDEQIEIAKQLREISDYVRRTYSLSEVELLALERGSTISKRPRAVSVGSIGGTPLSGLLGGTRSGDSSARGRTCGSFYGR